MDAASKDAGSLVLIGLGLALLYSVSRYSVATDASGLVFGATAPGGDVFGLPNDLGQPLNELIPLTVSPSAQSFIQRQENRGLYDGTITLAMPYGDAGGQSVGFGHHIMPGENFSAGLTREAAIILFGDDIAHVEQVLNDSVTVPLTQNQFDALADLVYNVGPTEWLHGGPGHGPATILLMLNGGNYAGAANEFARWNHSQGQVSDVLTARRAADQQLFETQS